MSKHSLQICACIDADSKTALDLASQLELDRGVAVVGSVWTKGDMLQYLTNPYNKIFCWSDELGSYQHDERMPYKFCKYRVVIGITYNISEAGVYEGKFIDHMVVDGSVSVEDSYKYVFEVLDFLAVNWDSEAAVRRLGCAVDSRDIRWLDVLSVAGFEKTNEVENPDATLIYMERR